MARPLAAVCLIAIAGCKDAPSLRQVFHLCDWHYVPKDQFAADLRSEGEYSEDEIDSLYANHLDAVEAVQKEEIEQLRALVRRHGITSVWVEGLTPGDMPDFRELVRQVRTVDVQEIPRLEKQLHEVQKVLTQLEAAGEQDSKEQQQALGVQKQILELLDEQRQRRLRIGAAGELLMRGELSEIMPLDDDETHKAANPVRGGKVVLSAETIGAREEAMVTRLLASDEPVSVIVLGAAHDLRTRLERRGVGYKQVIPGQVARLLEELE